MKSWYKNYKLLNDENKHNNIYIYKILQIDGILVKMNKGVTYKFTDILGDIETRTLCVSNFSKLRPLIDKWQSGKLGI